MQVDVSAVSLFFARWTARSDQLIELRLIVPDVPGATQRFCSTTREATDLAVGHSGLANVYVGACPRAFQSGRRESVQLVRGAWADLDFHQLDPTSRDVALELGYRRIEALGIPPTLLVHTGNGLQAWWVFDEPAAITERSPVERFESINRAIAERLGGDAVHDVARVLRVPGTMNLPDARKRARGCVPVMARLLDAGGPRYRPDDFVSLVATTTCPPPSRGQGCPVGAAPIEAPDAAVVVAFQRLLRRLGPHHPLTRTWEGRRQLRDNSRSGFDWAFARQCARVGITPDQVAALMRIYGFGKGHDATSAYLLRTVARAYAHESSHRAG